jgi:hypothetical protein
MKDVLSTGEAFSSQQRIFAIQNMKFLIFFLLLWPCGSFMPSGFGSAFSTWIRIRIQPTNVNANPNPETVPPSPSINQRGHSGIMRDGTEVIFSPPLSNLTVLSDVYADAADGDQKMCCLVRIKN